MTEKYPADVDLDALDAGVGDTGLPHSDTGQAPHYTNQHKRHNWLDRVLARANDCRVYQDTTDGALECSIYAGADLRIGGVVGDYAGSLGNTLTNNATNYIYLDAAFAVQINTTGFPTTGAAHFPLAEIVAAAGVYDLRTDITDKRSLFAGAMGASSTVEANTAGVGSPNVITAAETGKTFTNEGATAKNYHTLPAAVAGLEYTFIVADTDGMRITAAAGDTINIYDQITVGGGYIDATAVGAVVRLTAINATKWIATSLVGLGAWSVQTS